MIWYVILYNTFVYSKKMQSKTAVSFRIVPPCFVSPWRVFIGKRANFSATRQSLPCCAATIRPALAVIVMMWRRWLDFADCRCPPSLFLSHVQSFDVIWPVAHHDANFSLWQSRQWSNSLARQDTTSPLVTISIGLPCIFLLGKEGPLWRTLPRASWGLNLNIYSYI